MTVVAFGVVGSVAEMKARQTAKMREIREALIADGFDALDEQAAVLELPRSTTWTIIKGNLHGSGRLFVIHPIRGHSPFDFPFIFLLNNS